MTIDEIMTRDESGAGLVAFARQTADKLIKADLKRSQIRSIFTEVRQIQALWSARPAEARRRLNMLKPKLDYQTWRNRPVGGLKDVLCEAIDQVDHAQDDQERDARFRRFVDLFEAILAYHRALGGAN